MNRLSVVDSILLLEKVRRDSLEQQFLTETVTYNLWKNAGRKIMEAELTADQIEQLFQTVQQTATAGGDNRTAIGKGKDIASAVSSAVGSAWKDLKDKIYNSGPMTNFAAAYDKQAEKLKQATGGDEGVFKYIKKYREFAEKHPVIQSFIYSALIAAAGVTGAGVGGAIALGLFKLTDQLLQGKDVRSAIYQAAKTGIFAYGASKLGDLIRGGSGDAAGTVAGFRGFDARGKDVMKIVVDKVKNGEITDWNSYQDVLFPAIDQAVEDISDPGARAVVRKMTRDYVKTALDRWVATQLGR